MNPSHVSTVGLLLVSAGLAVGQSQTLVFTQDNDEPGGAGRGIIATAPEVGVGQDAVLEAANRRIALYTRVPGLLELRPINAVNFPFEKGLHPDHLFGKLTNLWDPRANHDPIDNRLWMVYAEGEGHPTRLYQVCGPVSRLHLAVNKHPDDFPVPGSALDTLDDTHWHYYTGDGVPPTTKAGPFFELRHFPNPSPYTPYQGEAGHGPPTTTLRLPTLGFDEQAIFVTPNELNVSCESPNGLSGDQSYTQHIFIIPRVHDAGASSILDGDKPADIDITHIDTAATQVVFPDGRIEDNSDFYYAVQEPYPEAGEQVPNTTMFINVIDRFAEIQTDLRLRGIYDADPGAGVDWTLQQQTSSLPGPIDLIDTALPSSLHFANPTRFLFTPLLPRTPDATWRPNAVGVIFHSAVLVKDTENEHRIFAVHAVQPAEEVGGSVVTEDKWVVQWYVIDPKLGDFGTGTTGAWQPEILEPDPSGKPGALAAGRIEFSEGDAYHPVIVVNRQGQAFIEYTFSDDTTWPQIRRVRLTNDYTATVAGSDVLVRNGPPIPYVPGSGTLERNWADYADAQADPFNQCAYWSTHTLVHEPDNQDPPLTQTDERDVWLFHQAYFNSTSLCFQSNALLDLNDDTEVDVYDMAAFGPMFDRGARRVDIDGNGVVEARDMVLYMDAYNAYRSRR